MGASEGLAGRECVPCKGGVPPLEGEALARLQAELGGGWTVAEGKRLEKTFRFPDFRRAMDFANRVGDLAEAVNHHPDLHVAWGKVKVEIWTHKIGGLTESDFVFAAKTDRLS